MLSLQTFSSEKVVRKKSLDGDSCFKDGVWILSPISAPYAPSKQKQFRMFASSFADNVRKLNPEIFKTSDRNKTDCFLDVTLFRKCCAGIKQMFYELYNWYAQFEGQDMTQRPKECSYIAD